MAGTLRAITRQHGRACPRASSASSSWSASVTAPPCRARPEPELGFSHPVCSPRPRASPSTTPTQTEILVAGADKQRVGEVAAKIRGFRPPEPYKGKGVKYSGEKIISKEAKKA
jgi:hypothetical protein